MEILAGAVLCMFCLICRVNPVVTACLFFILARGL